MFEEYPSYIPQPDRPTGLNVQEEQWFISADLGQANDYTAISLIQRILTGYGVRGLDRRGERALYLRHIERIREVEYPAIVERLKNIYLSPALTMKTKSVVIDYTGLGRPVYDMMVKAGFRHSLNAISITGGNDPSDAGTHYNVPKRDLVSTMQIELQNDRLHFASGLKEKNALIEELTNFQTAISASGHDTYNGANGIHDDIVMSVSMGVWLACRNYCRWGFDKDM